MYLKTRGLKDHIGVELDQMASPFLPFNSDATATAALSKTGVENGHVQKSPRPHPF